MQLIPAIDLLHGEVVRLHHGNFDEATQYDITPLQLANDYAMAGAEWLHVVDLAASRDGQSAKPDLLLTLLQQAKQSVQTGGGVRSGDDIALRLEHGAARVVIGTLCLSQTPRFLRWLDEFGAERIVSALDVTLDTPLDEGGTPWPRTHGWTRAGDRSLWDVLDELTGQGLQHLLCTDIGRDGALSGPNLTLYRELRQRYPELEIQASGGVAGLNDLRHLRDTGVAAAISGKALLEGCFTMAEALE
ncbi:MAG: HisA/HisF-related TIM barrel protein, partial [Lysobacterales bacterium]